MAIQYLEIFILNFYEKFNYHIVSVSFLYSPEL